MIGMSRLFDIKRYVRVCVRLRVADADVLSRYCVGGFVSDVSKFAGVSLARTTKSTEKDEYCSHIDENTAGSPMRKSLFENGSSGLQ
jgi:hypothetical protein